VLVAHVHCHARSMASLSLSLVDMVRRLDEAHITVRLHPGDFSADGAKEEMDPNAPRVLVSVGESSEGFPGLAALPLSERRRWVRFPTFEEVDADALYRCWLSATDPLPACCERPLPESRFTCDMPLVSIFTSAFRSGEKILRPHASLRQQTYANWEWVIVDDSGDDDATYRRDLVPLAEADRRVRVYRQQRRSGYIGAAKRWAAGLCRGEIMVEVDHDDLLDPRCLERLVDAFVTWPECGFAYGQSAETHVGSHDPHTYGPDFGYGFGMYWRQWCAQLGGWQNVVRSADINSITLTHLIGLPNHPRAWTRDAYHLCGGHRIELSVSDDYDLLVRTFLCTRFVQVPHMLYIQYINEGGDNQTSRRNAAIQVLCDKLYRHYRERIDRRIRALGMPLLQQVAGGYRRVWDTPRNSPRRAAAQLTHIDSVEVGGEARPRVTRCFAFPTRGKTPPGERERLLEALADAERRGWDASDEIVVAGAMQPEVLEYARRAPDGYVRWWTLEDHGDHGEGDGANVGSRVGLKECVKYAEMIGGGGPVVWGWDGRENKRWRQRAAAFDFVEQV
jgi:O-antigen biosynthesis protein